MLSRRFEFLSAKEFVLKSCAFPAFTDQDYITAAELGEGAESGGALE
jgi:hypothetical protein